MKTTQIVLIALTMSLVLLALSPNVNALFQYSNQPQLTKAPLIVHIVNANTGGSISGALVWFDGYLAGTSDAFGVVGISVTHPTLGHSYLVSAGGYQVEKGSISIGPTSDGHLTVKLAPIHQ